MALEIRPVREDEAASFVETVSTAFLQRPDVERIAAEIWPMWEGGRTWAAVDDGQICGTFRSWPTELTVPGLACLPAAGVSAVTVLPTHRRRGVLRSMTATEHAAIRESGQVFGLLHASEYRIYGRFGYGPGTREATWMLDAERTTFHGSPEGSVELVTPGDEARAALSSVFDAWRVGQVGEIRRRDHSWDFDLGLRDQFWEPKWSGFLALHRNVAGEVDGYARYRAEERWEQRQPRNTLQVDELHGLTLEASAALWRFLAEIDWVATVRPRAAAHPTRCHGCSRTDVRRPYRTWATGSGSASSMFRVRSRRGHTIGSRASCSKSSIPKRRAAASGSPSMPVLPAQRAGSRTRART